VNIQIHPALSSGDLDAIRLLFVEYASSLSIDLGYQGFAAELDELPGAYAPPRGRLLLATVDDEPAGCVALRPRAERIAEMKRLYVRPSRQGLGLGRRLAERVIADAREAGCTLLLLDTLPTTRGALRLYESLGFVRRAPYFASPVAGNVFMELRLAGADFTAGERSSGG
jgi:GNAT superfamily N-acetyltransferase